MPAPIYLDHHATTPADPRVVEAMIPYFSAQFGNPSSRAHAAGRAARDAVEAARAEVAALIGAHADEIIFTSGATESDNLALLGAVPAGGRLVTQRTEHSAVLGAAQQLEARGVHVERLPVDAEGFVSLGALDGALREPTALVSVMLANNEIGTAQDIGAIAARARAAGALYHCDTAQGLGYLPLDVEALGVDMLSVSGHKIYGPKGVGALYLRRSARPRLAPQSYGGGQEGGLRAGSLNVPGIVGLGRAARIMREEGPTEAIRLRQLAEKLLAGLLHGVPELGQQGAPQGPRRHPGNLHLRVPFAEASALLLDLEDTVALSTGSACASESTAPSHVLTALGLSREEAKTCLRFGLGRSTTAADIDTVIEAVVRAVAHRRERSPLWALHLQGRAVTW